MEDKKELHPEVKNIINKVKPEWKISSNHIGSGCGFVTESVFSFSKCGSVWIVYFCHTGNFAFKEIDCEWVENFSGLILESDQMYVEYDINHQIIAWSAIQEKHCSGHQ